MSVPVTPPTRLFINPSASRCGACGQNADPHEKQHLTVWGWHGAKPGCGVTFTHLSSDYSNVAGLYESAREMRPDLIDDFEVRS